MVVANADGTRGVPVDACGGVQMPRLADLGGGLLTAGIVLGLIAIGLIVLGGVGLGRPYVGRRHVPYCGGQTRSVSAPGALHSARSLMPSSMRRSMTRLPGSTTSRLASRCMRLVRVVAMRFRLTSRVPNQ